MLNTKINKCAGFTLVEVMVAMVIFSVGLLGLAGLQSLGVQNNQTAFFRTIAMQQAYNMGDRMRNNISGVIANQYDALDENIPTLRDCLTAACTPNDLAQFDHFEWNTNNAAELPDGQGTVTALGNDRFLICVMWNELKVPTPVGVPSTCDIATYDPTTHYKFYVLNIEL